MIQLEKTLKEARRRIQLERLLKGAAILLGYLFVVSLLSSYFLAQNNFSDSAIFWCRFWFGLGLLLLLWRFLLSPLMRRPGLGRIAQFLEERNPRLKQRISTAVEVTDSERIHPDLQGLIRRDAYRELKKVPIPRFFWPQVSQLALLSILLSLLIGSLLYIGGPAEYSYGLGKLLGSWLDEPETPLYRITVDPGNAKVAERADLDVRARLLGFESEAVDLYALYPNNSQWESARMIVDGETAEYLFTFFDIREPIQYYVEADGIRSDPFQIEVSDIPRVEAVRITLKFPGYTGLSDVTMDDEQQIRALRGTEVLLQVRSDQAASGGFIRFEAAGDLAMEQTGLAEFEAGFKVEGDDYFRIHLSNTEGVSSPASDEFSVEALEDQKPTISFTYPGRDKPVTNIEEVFTELKVEDDYGIRDLSLRFSVNGGEEQNVPLKMVRGSKRLNTSHTFYLEEFDLTPGDFISYYGKTSDAVTSSVTDIFFLEVEPFDKEFRQSQMNAGGAASGQRGLELSKQQKQITVATFSLVQEKKEFSAEELLENSQTLALVQQRLQTQVQTIIERIERRGAAASDARFRQMTQYLSEALTHMAPAEEELNAVRPSEALPHEQKALQKLLRAEALFNEVQVSMSQNGGGAASPQELADLVDLELDRTKNQYETLQQNRQQQQDQAMDEALEKLKELARRQEQELKRQRRAMASGSGGQSSQQDLIDEVEKLSRELARLSRQQQNQQLSRISRELDRAARELRKSASSGQNSQQSMEMAQQAMERLRQAREALSQQRQSQVREEFQDLKAQADNLVKEQKEVVQGISQMERPVQGQQPSENFYRSLREMYWKKQGLQQQLQELEGKLHQSARRFESEEPEASKKLKDAGLSIRDQRVPEKMREGSDFLANGLVSLAERREEGVADDLERLAEKIRDAERALGTGGQENSEERLRQALSEAGSLVEKLESLRERVGDGRQNQSQAPGQSEQSGQPDSQQEGQGQESRQASSQQGGQPGNRQGDRGQPQGAASPENAQNQNQSSQSEGTGQQGIAPQIAHSSGPMASSGINPGMIQREWSERVREAEELGRLLRGVDRGLAREAGRLLQQMQQIDLDRILADEEEVRRLKSSLIDGFHQLELEISRALKDETEDFLRPVNQDEVPPEFRERVEDYYRRLSVRREQDR